jgi:hypothetical protein
MQDDLEQNDLKSAYPPLNTLKPIATNVWIVDGPTLRFGMPWLKIPFPTRMTVIRIGGDLFIHSPTPLPPSLRIEIESIGQPRWIIGPNRLHYWWIRDWISAFPEAEAYLAPRIEEQAQGRIDFPHRALDGTRGYPWDDAIDTLPVHGSFMTEVVFFHRASRTLVLTDFIENFEAHKIRSSFLRWVVRSGGALAPDGGMPRDMRFSYRRHRTQMKAAVEQMIAWNPERVIIAHGRWFETNGTAELQRAFRWLG